MSKKFTRFGRICVTYVLVIAMIFSFVMSSFVGLDIKVSANTTPPASTIDTWDGTKPTSLDGLGMNGVGTSERPYEITNGAQLWFAVNNTNANYHFIVMNDIVLNNTDDFDAWDDNSPYVDWNPTGAFVGTFDGNGKTISGLYVSADFTGSAHGGFGGLFYMIGTGANIYNIVLEKAYISQTQTDTTARFSRVGGIVGSIVSASNVNIFGCVVKNSKIYNKVPSYGYVGGILGGLNASTVTIANCSVVDTVLSGTHAAGLFSGNNWTHTVTLSNCFVTDYVLTLESGITTNNCYVGGVDIDKADMKGEAALTNMNLLASEWNATDDYPQAKTRSQLWQYFKPQDKDTNATNFAGGDGTANSPYQITNAAQLYKAVNNTVAGKYFKVMNDIVVNDASNFGNWNDSSVFTDWTPNATFVGTFDGNGKTISGLYVSADFTGSAHGGFGGLFYMIGANANIYNIVLEKAYISQTSTAAAWSRVGGIVGSIVSASNVNIYGCVVKNSKIYNKASSNGYVGGILGGLNASTVAITNSSVVDTVLSGNKVAGLFSGNNWTHTVTLSNCFVTDYVLTLESGITTNNCYVGGVDIDKADMKDQAALTNMSLSIFEWEAEAESYPTPVLYTTVNAFTEADKNTGATSFAGGDGTANSPYQITNAAQLYKAVNNTEAGKYFKVMNDITVNSVKHFDAWNNESNRTNWTPTAEFTGTFDGNGKTISGLYSVGSTSNTLGLFSKLGSNATIYNVIVDKAYFVYTATSLAYVGGLVGRSLNTNDIYVYGCVVKNSKLGNNSTSGDGTLAGFIGAISGTVADVSFGIIENSCAVDNVLLTRESDSQYVTNTAGFVGMYWGAAFTINNCFTSGGYSFGSSNNGGASFSINNCYTDGECPYYRVPSILFAWVSSSIDQRTSDQMKGEEALTNMNLSALEWDVDSGKYPMPKAYETFTSCFKPQDKNMNNVTFAGTGEIDDPYQITNSAELWKAVHSDDSTKYYKVMNDITINNTDDFSTWNDNSRYEDWNPTGTFSGNFDGNNKRIIGLYVSHKLTERQGTLGLFSKLGSNANVYNVILEKAYISQTNTEAILSYVGGIAGSAISANDVNIVGCAVKDSKIYNRANRELSTGGIVAITYTSSINFAKCSVVDTVIENTNATGTNQLSAIVANYWDTTINFSDCFVTDYPLAQQGKYVTVVNNCYISGNVEKPFAEVDVEFNDAKYNIKKIDNALMKGPDALDNLLFSQRDWTTTTDSYPIAKPYSTEKNVWEGNKTVTSFAQLEGEGTAALPYLITNGDELWFAVNNTSKTPSDKIPYFALQNDIQLNAIAGYKSWNIDAPANSWNPTKAFVGHFDGNYNTIIGLYSAPTTESSVGLFAAIDSNSSIKNLNLSKSYIKAGEGTTETVVGGIVGKVDGKTNVSLSGLKVQDTVLEGRGRTGGIVGLIANSTGSIIVERCVSVDNTISFVDLGNGTSAAAGLVGDVVDNTIDTVAVSNSFTTSNYICRQAGNTNFNKVYTTSDIAKPFAAEGTAFGGGVKAIALAEMKGANAIENMDLDKGYWEATLDSYPVAKPYSLSTDFKAEDKNLTLSNLKGAGTEVDPYRITNAAELWVAVNNTDPDNYFKVMNDITVNTTKEFKYWNNDSSLVDWDPTEAFSGNFNGNKMTISGLYAATSSSNSLGLFSKLGSDATVYDVTVDSAYFVYTSTSLAYVGGLAGRSVDTNNVLVYGCVVKNSKLGNNSTSGDGTLAGCIGAVNGTVGGNYSVTIENCYAVDNNLLTRDSDGQYTRYTAGFIGMYWGSTASVTHCFSNGGYPFAPINNSYGTFTNCYTDAERPYMLATSIIFDWTKGQINQLSADKMQGRDALKNMQFSASSWEATDSYPQSKKYVETNGTVGAVWSGYTAREFAGGDGTKKNPYQIDTAERLHRMVNKFASTEAWFIITEDIKINDTSADNWYESDDVKAWSVAKKFKGHVDGQGHTITGLYVDNTSGSTDGAGLIPYAYDRATITNINIDKCYAVATTSKSHTSFIVGYMPSNAFVKIAGCNITNAVVDSAYSFGGIIDHIHYGIAYVEYCTFQGKQIGDSYGSSYVGGIVGDCTGDAIVTNSISIGMAAIGGGSVTLGGVYSNVAQGSDKEHDCNVIVLDASKMTGTGAKANMSKLNWKYMRTTDGIPTASDPIDYFSDKNQGTPDQVWSGMIAHDYAGGTGTEADPYLISTPEQLYMFSIDSMAREMTTPKYYKITHDIKLNKTNGDEWYNKSGLNNWLASAAGSQWFYGHVDGDHHVIYGMYSYQDSKTVASYFGLVPRAKGGSSFKGIGFSKGYIKNDGTKEAYSALFVGFMHTPGSTPIPAGEYTPIKFTECFVDNTVQVHSWYAGGFTANSPIGADFVDCYSNVYINDTAKSAGAFMCLSSTAFQTYPASFTRCYSKPANKEVSMSSVVLFRNEEDKSWKVPENTITDCYYFGGRIDHFGMLFYKYMHGDDAKTHMKGFDFDETWLTVDGGTPVLRDFANAEKFSDKTDVYSTITFSTGTEEITVPEMTGVATSKLTLPVIEREGYFFDCWCVYEEGNWKYDYGIFPVVDTMLYAKWNANSVTQNFENYVNTEYDYDDDYVYYRPGVAGYTSLKVHGGGKAILRKGESAAEQDVILNATEPIAVGEEYTIRFWVLTEEAADATISLVHYSWPDYQDPAVAVEKMVQTNTMEVGEWTMFTHKFKAEAPWLGIRTTGNAAIFMDDFFILPVAEYMKDASKVNDYDYFYNLGETDKTTTTKTQNSIFATAVETLAPTSAVTEEDTTNRIALLTTIILAASALVVLSGAYLSNIQKTFQEDIEE